MFKKRKKIYVKGRNKMLMSEVWWWLQYQICMDLGPHAGYQEFDH